MAVEKSQDEILQWFEKDLLPRLVVENKFPVPGIDPSNLSVSKLVWETSHNRNTDHFASRPYFLLLTLCDSVDRKISKDFPLLIKFIPQNKALRAHMDIESQFWNEAVLFMKVLPVYRKFLEGRPNISPSFLDDVVPLCYYSHIDLEDPDYGIVILEDLRPTGYSPAKSLVELDYNHCKLAVQQLAKFQALSYAMKLEEPETFETLKNCSKDIRYNEDAFKEHTFGTLLEKAGVRAIDYMLKQEGCEVPKDYLLKLRKVITSGIYNKLREVVAPKEPLAVLIHGDFCRNNLLFRFANGVPDGCVLIDFATFRYGNPCFDLCFFLYLNTTLAFREKYFDELFRHYHSTLIQTTASILNKTEKEIADMLPLNLFVEDFNDQSLTGYVTVAFFLPVMLFPDQAGSIEEDVKFLTPEESADKNAAMGGEEGSKRISEVIIDMYRRGAYRSGS